MEVYDRHGYCGARFLPGDSKAFRMVSHPSIITCAQMHDNSHRTNVCVHVSNVRYSACEALCTPPCVIVSWCPPSGAEGCGPTGAQPRPATCYVFPESARVTCSKATGWMSAVGPTPPPPHPPDDWAALIAVRFSFVTLVMQLLFV